LNKFSQFRYTTIERKEKGFYTESKNLDRSENNFVWTINYVGHSNC